MNPRHGAADREKSDAGGRVAAACWPSDATCVLVRETNPLAAIIERLAADAADETQKPLFAPCGERAPYTNLDIVW
jgi:hypothetical protein